MGRGRSGSLLPIIALVVLALTMTVGVIIFGASMKSAYIESNYTAEQTTLMPYEINSAWFYAAAILVLIFAVGFAFYYFWG